MNIMFVLTVAILTTNCMAKISVDDSAQHVAKFSHTASVPSCATSSLPGKLETDDSISFRFSQANIRLWDDLGLCGHISRFSNLKLTRF